MIRILITKTSKSYSPKSKFVIFDEESKYFSSLKDAKLFLKSEYSCSKSPAYIDKRESKNGFIKIGWIYGFKNSDDSGGKWIQRDWVSFYDVQYLDLDNYS